MTPPNSSPVRPLHLGKYLPPPHAGIEDHTHALLSGLQQRMPCTLVAGASPGQGAAVPTPYRVLTARQYGRLASAFITPGVIPLALRELASGRCNLLHLHLPNPWADLLAQLAPVHVPIVATWHSDIVRQRRILWVYRHIQQATLRRVRRVIVPTPAHAHSSHQLAAVPVDGKLVHIPYGIDVQALQPSLADPATAHRIRAFAAGRPIILTVGRHVYYKGYDYLIQAMALLRSPAVLVMVGQGPLTPQLHALAAQLGVQSRILFMGPLAHAGLVAALHGCDIFTLPSIAPSEAFGLASAEAMACGKPTVVCQLGNGVNVVNQDGVTSLAVRPRDPAALAAALDHLALHPQQRATMGAAARQHIQRRYSLDAMIDATAQLYHEVCDLVPSGGPSH